MTIKIPETISQISLNTWSKNGHPIFDLMKPVKTDPVFATSGYIGASGIAFYTEDKTILENYKEVQNHPESTLEKEIAFMKTHPQCIVNYSDIPAMGNKEQMAFIHLSTPESRERTFRQQNFGIAFLEKDAELLIFHQSNSELRKIFKGDLSNKLELRNAHLKLMEVFESGKIEPDCKITDGAFKILKEQMKDIILVPNVDKNHPLNEEISLLIGFMNSYHVKMEINQKENSEINIKLNQNGINKEYDIRKPLDPFTQDKKTNSDTIELKSSFGDVEIWNEMKFSELLTTIYQDSRIVEKSIDNFLKQNKNRI